MEDRKWSHGDSARRMTQKYNSIVDSVDSLAADVSNLPEIEQSIMQSIEQTVDAVNSRLGGLSKSDVGLGSVDNTPDSDKPVSTPQAQAIKWAKEEAMADMLTSQPVSGSPVGDGTAFITNVSVSGTKLVISM